MKAKDFLAAVVAGEIPPEAPDGCPPGGWNLSHDFSESFLAGVEVRGALTRQYGMWAIVDQQWTAELAKWIGARKCLEIMAGLGWLAHALELHGVTIHATDNMSKDWAKGQIIKPFPVVKPTEAVTAVKSAKGRAADVLIVSWPPYGSKRLAPACAAWGPDRPIVYIGELGDGCTGSAEFFEGFIIDKAAPSIEIPSWPGLHDYLRIGHWRREYEG